MSPTNITNPGGTKSMDGKPLVPVRLADTYRHGDKLPALALHPGEEPGRAFYESKAAMADPAHPWATWERLHQWERDREAVNAWGIARGVWAQAHREATSFPPCIPAVRWHRGDVQITPTPDPSNGATS